LGDEVSTKKNIDIAMQLGTNYPYGPFEWAAHIGLEHIYKLLKNLSISDERFVVAKALEVEWLGKLNS
jgi:3-hydroxybutyryl-CoA dehydrogenase